MLIVVAKECYIRPHKHLVKSETFLVLEGSAQAILFDDAGRVRNVLEMGPPGCGRTFFYRMPEAMYHGLLIESDWLVFLETTSGPFDPAKSVDAAWAPDEGDSAAVEAFLKATGEQTARLLRERMTA